MLLDVVVECVGYRYLLQRRLCELIISLIEISFLSQENYIRLQLPYAEIMFMDRWWIKG